MVKIIAIVVVVLVGFLIYAETRPDELRVQRAISIKAPPEKIIPLIADFHGWTAWSPWEKLDPAMQRTYSGAASGKGAVYAWEGNSKVGAGRMEITDVTQPSKVTIQLDFIKPIGAHNVTEFVLEPKGDATDVTWTMQGKNAYMAKLMGIFVNMDNMIGKDFEAGLANMKSAAER